MRTWIPSLLTAFLLASCNCGGAQPGDLASSDAADPAVSDDASESDMGDAGPVCTAGTLALTPSTASVTLDGSASPAPISFSVTAAGSAVAANTLLWKATRDDDASPGKIDAGVLSPNPNAGGKVTVTADDGCGHTASATVDFTLKATTNTADPQTVTRFGGTVVSGSAKAPSPVYPGNDTRFPRNIYKQLFQWQTNGAERFRLTFTGAASTIEVYTDGKHALCASAMPAAGCWESDEKTWAWIASSNAGGTVDLVIDGVFAGDTNVYRSKKVTLGFSKRDVSGAIFYWSTTSAGIRRASVSDARPESYEVAKPTATVLADNSSVKCVACHTVSRDGRKMIAGTQTTKASGLLVYDVTADSPPKVSPSTALGGQHEFGTFSPDDARIVATLAGALAEYDAKTGAKVTTLALGGLKATHPDFSPKGDAVVFATGSGDAPSGASLAVIPTTGPGAWGQVKTLVPAAGKTNLFPSFSPAGDWVAYSRGTKGGHGDATTQLFIAKSDGTGMPLELLRANREVNGAPTNGQFENNQPTWAPPGDYQWVAFNSLRPYGVVAPNGGTQQIWVAAIDLNRAAQGLDPSYPAFRFSFQDLTEDNHRAFWVRDVRVDDADGGTPGRDAGCFETCPKDGGVIPDDAGTPADAGACLPVGTGCDQTSGPSCCGSLVCDQNSAGDYVCRSRIN